jgi:hypothetical protein
MAAAAINLMTNQSIFVAMLINSVALFINIGPIPMNIGAPFPAISPE